MTIERFTRGDWKKLQTVVVKALPGYVQYAEKKSLRFKVPKGTTIRAVLPRSQAGACYLAGYSTRCRRAPRFARCYRARRQRLLPGRIHKLLRK